MSSLLNKAVAGVNDDDEARRVLLGAAKDGLMRQAGMIPGEETSTILKTCDLEAYGANQMEAFDAAYSLAWLRNEAASNFENYQDACDVYLPRHLKPLMPKMSMARSCKALYEIVRWLNGRGWVAGSAALWTVTDGDWLPKDIDIFCRTEEFYEMLREELCELGYEGQKQSSRSFVYWTHPFYIGTFATAINLISPANEDWREIEDLLLGFDWSVAAVAIADFEDVYAYNSTSIRTNGIMDIIEEPIKRPKKLIKRLFKYMERGYTVSYTALKKMVLDGRFFNAFELIGQAANYSHNEDLKFLVYRWNTCIQDLEAEENGIDYEEYESDSGDYEFEDGDEPYSD
jgi:hypothetical protein